MTPNSAGAERGDRELLCPHPAVPPLMSPTGATHCPLCVLWCQHPPGPWSAPFGTVHPRHPVLQHPWVGVSLHPIRSWVCQVSSLSHYWGPPVGLGTSGGHVGDTWGQDTAPHTPACAPRQGTSPLRGRGGDIGVSPRSSSLSRPPKTPGGKAGAAPHPDAAPGSGLDALPGQDLAQPIPN